MHNNLIIKESYDKSSGDDFMAKGRCKALFRGPENIDINEIYSIKAKLQKLVIRVFDIHLYNQIEITETELVDDWEHELDKYSDIPQFEVTIEKEAAIHFFKTEWENVDFIRTGIDKGILINPRIIYAYQEDKFTFGEIEGELLFKVHNLKPEIRPVIAEKIPVVNNKTIIRSTFESLLPARVTSSDLPMMQSAGCFWSIFRFLVLFLLAVLLIKGCSHFSSTVWNQDRDNTIKNDSTLRIPEGDEKVLKDGNKKFKIDPDATIVVPPGAYKLFISDHGSKVDHDKINLFVNGKLFRRNMELFLQPTEIALTNLRYGENYVDFAVVDQGDEGNCTAKIIFVNTIDNSYSTTLKVNNTVNHVSRLKLIQR